MKLTPLDIKRQEFTRTFRGIDADEVHSFLQMVADQWEKLLDENRRIDQQVRDLEGKLVHYRKIEEALQEALETARNNSNRTIENAQREAQIILKEAKNHADELRTQVRNERTKLKHDVSKILGRKDEIVARLRAFLMSEMEILARFEKHDQMGLLQIDSSTMNSIGYSSDAYEVEHPTDAAPPTPTPREKPVQQQRPVSEPVQQPPAPQHTPPPEPEVQKPISPLRNQEQDSDTMFEEHEDSRQSFSNAGNGQPIDSGEIEFDTHLGAAFTQAVAENAENDQSDGLSTDELEFIKSTVTSAAAFDDDEDTYASSHSVGEEEEGASVEEWHASDPVSHSVDPFEDENRPYHMIMPDNGENDAYFEEDATEQHDDALGGGWIVRPVTSNTQSNPDMQGGFNPVPGSILGDAVDDEEVSATPEEIEKIRRILNDLD